MGNGERVRVGLTVGKNVKLEKNHVPCCQADHWVWNVGVDAGILGGTVPWAWGPVLPLPPWAGHRWTWESSGEESQRTGACLGAPRLSLCPPAPSLDSL